MLAYRPASDKLPITKWAIVSLGSRSEQAKNLRLRGKACEHNLYGALYGTASRGGASFNGVVFRMELN